MERHVIVSRAIVNARLVGRDLIVLNENAPKNFMEKSVTISANVRLKILFRVIPLMDRAFVKPVGAVRLVIDLAHSLLMVINAIRSVIVEIMLNAFQRMELAYVRLATPAKSVKKNVLKELMDKIAHKGVNVRMELIAKKKLDR
jgi:hypothetical protein